MTREELWAKYQAGEPLSAIEEQDLAAGLRDDRELRDSCLRDFHLHGLLRARKRTIQDADDFERAFFQARDAQQTATRFLRKVESRIRETEPPDRRPKPPTRRHRPRRAGPGAWPSAFPLVAGLLLAAVALFVLWRMASTTPPPAPIARPKSAPPSEIPVEIPTPPPEPTPPPRGDDPRRQDDEGLRVIASRIREEVRAAEPPELPAPEPPPEPPRIPAPTRVQVATIDHLGGPVTVLAGDKTVPAKRGGSLSAGEGVEVDASAYATVLYPDGTRIDLGPGTRVGEFAQKSDKEGAGKWIRLDRGSLSAQVAKQTPGQPLVVRTSQGEARVVGTVLRVLADPGRTRLEVDEGKVELRNAAGKAVMVDADHGASTSDLVSKPLAKVLFSDTFESSPKNQWPKGWIKAPTPDKAQRSSYVVIEESGKHYMGCLGTPPAWTQHAAVPWDDWGAVGRIEFKVRAAGPRNTRAGMFLGGAVGEFFL